MGAAAGPTAKEVRSSNYPSPILCEQAAWL